MVGEMRGLRLAPAAEYLIDGEQQGDALKLSRIPGCHRWIARAVKMLCRNLLSLRGIQVPQVLLGHFARAVFVDVLIDHADRRFGENADRGRDDIEFVGSQFLERKVSLVLP